MPERIGVALRSGPGAVCSQTSVVLGRRSTGAGEVEEIPFTELSDGLGTATTFIKTVLDDTTAANARATLGAQAQSNNLDAVDATPIAIATADATGIIAALVASGWFTAPA